MIAGAAAAIRARHAELSHLDSLLGDGDHGATMLRIVERLEKAVAGQADLKSAMREAGWAVLGVDGGASSALFGTFFLAAAEVVAFPFDTAGLATAFEAGLASVREQTKAQTGDKTLMDALVPAVEGLRRAAEAGKPVEEALRDAARDARAGAESTKSLVARYGRAKHLGDKTQGHPDPGAVSTALLFEGFYNGLTRFESEDR
jgi:dihydroxyacetone kinase-like protein